jgi:hypothetical protein
MIKETARSEDGRELTITKHDELADFEAIVAAVIGHFDGEVVKRVEAWPLGEFSVFIKCAGELVDVVFDEAWGISIRAESESPKILQSIADFLESYLPKYRVPGAS